MMWCDRYRFNPEDHHRLSGDIDCVSILQMLADNGTVCVRRVPPDIERLAGDYWIIARHLDYSYIVDLDACANYHIEERYAV